MVLTVVSCSRGAGELVELVGTKAELKGGYSSRCLVSRNGCFIVFFCLLLPPGDEWYLCRLTLSMPSQADLQWAMFPAPYLGAVGPDAAPGSVVYRLLARQRDGTLGQAQYLLLDGECMR